VALGNLKSRLLGLTNLFGDTLVLGFEFRVALGLVMSPGGELLILAGVGSYVAKDAHLGDVGVIFGIDSLKLGVEGGVSVAGQAGIALVDLDVGIALVEVIK
jgi:hypothetical protein